MLSNTELVELPNNLVKILAKRAEDHREFTLLLLVEYQSTEEGGDQVELSFAKHIHLQLLLLCELVLVVDILVVVVEWLAPLDFEREVERIIQLLFGTLWEGEGLQHLLEGVFEFGSQTTRFCKA